MGCQPPLPPLLALICLPPPNLDPLTIRFVSRSRSSDLATVRVLMVFNRQRSH